MSIFYNIPHNYGKNNNCNPIADCLVTTGNR
jgi:hypothetical protein